MKTKINIFFKGLLAAIPLAFILPAVCFLKLEDGSVFSSLKIGSLGLAIFGIGATVIGIVSLIIQVPIQAVKFSTRGGIHQALLSYFSLLVYFYIGKVLVKTKTGQLLGW